MTKLNKAIAEALALKDGRGRKLVSREMVTEVLVKADLNEDSTYEEWRGSYVTGLSFDLSRRDVRKTLRKVYDAAREVHASSKASP